MCKPATLRCAGLHNLLPVVWHLYFNKLPKLNIQFLNNLCLQIIQTQILSTFIIHSDKTLFMLPDQMIGGTGNTLDL